MKTNLSIDGDSTRSEIRVTSFNTEGKVEMMKVGEIWRKNKGKGKIEL